MSAADEAWQEWKSRGIGFSEEQDDAHEDTFMFAYRRALEDAADALEDYRNSFGVKLNGALQETSSHRAFDTAARIVRAVADPTERDDEPHDLDGINSPYCEDV